MQTDKNYQLPQYQLEHKFERKWTFQLWISCLKMEHFSWSRGKSQTIGVAVREKKSPVMCKAIFLAEKGKFQICQTLCVHNFDRNSKWTRKIQFCAVTHWQFCFSWQWCHNAEMHFQRYISSHWTWRVYERNRNLMCHSQDVLFCKSKHASDFLPNSKATNKNSIPGKLQASQ